MVKILHCADIHLGAPQRFLGAAAESRQIETLMTFEKITRTAKEKAVDLLLIAGDLFDNIQPEKGLADRVFRALADIAPIRVGIVAGNHDPLTADSPYKQELPKNVFVFGGENKMITFDDLKVHLYGRSFTGVYLTGESSFPIRPPQDDYCNILLLHGDTAGDLNVPYNGITTEFLAGCGMDYVALGHIHARSEILRAGATHYAYPGCPEGQGFDETGEKGILFGTVDQGSVSLEFLPMCRRQHLCVTLDLTGCNDPAKIVSMIPQVLNERFGDGFAEHLYKITLTGALPEETTISLNEIESRLNETVYFAKVNDQTTVAVDLETLANEPTLKGIFARQFAELKAKADPEQSELLDLALDLGLKAFRSEVKYREDS